jgi:hypothetical protein
MPLRVDKAIFKALGAPWACIVFWSDQPHRRPGHNHARECIHDNIQISIVDADRNIRQVAYLTDFYGLSKGWGIIFVCTGGLYNAHAL